jgi:AcrR family transcriptional regulator
MPKETFQNLKTPKRERFLAAAYLEFATHGYEGASVSRLVEEMGIAKGSIYQYFENKEDLYASLLEIAVTEKLAFIRNRVHSDAGPTDFVTLQAALVLAAVEFDFSHPQMALLMMNAARGQPEPRLAVRTRASVRRFPSEIESVIIEAIGQGAVRSDVDAALIVEFVGSATLSLGPYLEKKFAFSLVEQLHAPSRPLPFGEGELRQAVDQLVEMLAHGVCPPRTAGPGS